MKLCKWIILHPANYRSSVKVQYSEWNLTHIPLKIITSYSCTGGKKFGQTLADNMLAFCDIYIFGFISFSKPNPMQAASNNNKMTSAVLCKSQ